MYCYWLEVVCMCRFFYIYGICFLRFWFDGDDESKMIRRGKFKEVFCGDYFEKFVFLNDEFEIG